MSDNIEDLYPLSPLQQGMLFHALHAPEAGTYFTQLTCELRGALDTEAFTRAWTRVVEVHPILRTAIVWEDVEEPLQVVLRDVELPLLREDWRGLGAGERETRLAAWLEADRRRGFELGTAPLLRLALLRMAEDAWRFVFSHHHILLDGWSAANLLRQVFFFYEGLTVGPGGVDPHSSPLLEGEGTYTAPTRSRPFRDYIGWLQTREPGSAEAFWRRELADFSEPTSLSFLERPVATGRRGHATRRLRLPEELGSALQAFARQHGLTLSTLIQGAWALLLGHQAGAEDVVFGTTVSGRPAELSGVEAMVGLFINTLPVRVRLASGEPLLPWLRRLQEWQAELRQHEHSPLVKVQRWSGVPPGTPLFDTLVVFENYPVDAALTAPLRGVELHDVRTLEADHHALTLVATPGRELTLLLAYEQARCSAAQAERLLGQVRQLLQGMVARPQALLGELTPVDAVERHRLLVEWSGARAPVPPPGVLHRLFEAQAASTPDALALTFQGERLSYAELDARANQLAHHLRALGVGPESRVALCMARSPALVVGMLGILKAGGAFVPLDPEYPEARRRFVLEDSGAAVVLTEADLAREALARHPRTAPEVDVGPSSAAYVIYTSGSTGTPKGVLVEHGGVSNTVRAVLGSWRTGPGQRVLQFASVSFDASVLEIFCALLGGAALVLAPRDVLLPGAELARVLREERVTSALLTPSVLEVTPEEGLPHLETVLSGGEACTSALARRWGQGRRFINAYGPTEVSIVATLAELRPEADATPIGAPIAGARVYVLDERRRPVAIGARGELYVGGVGPARGYLGRPELSAERFVEDPFSEQPGARMYRTGDLARWRSDGQLDFLGRADAQVKVRGFRIEPGEVEAALRELLPLREVAVVAREGSGGEARLVAYLVPEAGAGLAERELRERLGSRLPAHLIPSAFVRMERLPLTPSGKLDRRALPAPVAQDTQRSASYEPPCNGTEEALAQVWSKVLGCPPPGRHDNFFELGGDSILAIQAVSRAAQAGVHVTARQLFLHPTLARLAAVAGAAPTLVAEQGPVTGPVVLTPIQRWFLEGAGAQPHHYNQTLLLAPRERLEPALLERALQHVSLHHDALRLRFTRAPSGRSWVQDSGTLEGGFAFQRVDLSGLGPEGRREALESHAARVQASLGLEGPLARAVLYEAGPEVPSRLLLTVHHLAVDVVSWRILLEDLLTAYQQLRAGEPVRLPPKTTSFQQWAERLDGFAQSPALREEADYWLGLPWARAGRLPVDRPEGVNTVASERTLEVALEAAETQALLHCGLQGWRARIEEVLPGALAEAVRRVAGVSCLLVDMEGHGREELFEGVDVSRTVGWFTSLYPVLLETREGGASSWLPGVKEALRGVPRRGVGYGLLRHLTREPALTERLRALPSAEVSFNYLGTLDAALPPGAPLALVREPVGPAHAPSTLRRHVLSLNAFISEGRLRIAWSYSEALHRRETLEALARGMVEVLRELAAPGAAEEGALAPSDFPLAPLTRASLGALVKRLVPGLAARPRELEDVYPLAPLQREMLARQLQAPGSGAYLVQVSCELEGALDGEAFVGAWREVVARHSILRTAFLHEGLEEPLQVVLREVPLPLHEEDWREVPGQEREARLSGWLARELRREFNPSRAPLLRLTLLRLGERTWRFVLGFSHLLLDGWSMPLVVRELFARYEALRRGRPLPSPEAPPFRDFIAWGTRGDGDASGDFWSRMFAGATWPAPARSEASAEPLPEYREVSRALPEGLSSALQRFARAHQLTLGTLLQAAWALSLRERGGEDVVFGTTVSVRPSALPEVESRVGPYIQMLPVRVRMPGSEPLLDWLRELQARLSELRQHEASTQEEIRRACGLPEGSALFDSLVVFENYPLEEGLGGGLAGLDVRDVRVHETSGVPLAVVGVPGRELRLHGLHDVNRFSAARVEGMLESLQRWLGVLAEAG